MSRYFILRDGEVIEEPDYSTWSAWYESSFKDVELIAEDDLGGSVVTTRFLSMAMSLAQNSPPMIFETVVRGGWMDNEKERFATLQEAMTGHKTWVRRVREADEENQLPPPGASW
jgi:hypothetical protein